MPCACGKSFFPAENSYRVHVTSPEHRTWRRLVGIEQSEYHELATRPAMYDCPCGGIHWTDSIIGRKHWALGAVGAAA